MGMWVGDLPETVVDYLLLCKIPHPQTKSVAITWIFTHASQSWSTHLALATGQQIWPRIDVRWDPPFFLLNAPPKPTYKLSDNVLTEEVLPKQNQETLIPQKFLLSNVDTSSTSCLICSQGSHLKHLRGSYTFDITLDKRIRVEQAYPVSARRFKLQMMEKVMGGLFCLQNAQPQWNGRLGLSTTSPKSSWNIGSVILRGEEEQQYGTTSSFLLI
jgi:hypothetical protein